MIKEVNIAEFSKWMRLYNKEYFTNKEIMTIKSFAQELAYKRLGLNDFRSNILFYEVISNKDNEFQEVERRFKEEGDNKINRVSLNTKLYNLLIIYKREDGWFLSTFFIYSSGIENRYLIDGFDSLISFIKEKYKQ